MDFNLIKKLLKKEKTRLILLEDGKPTMVILPIEEYLGEELNPSNNPTSSQNPKNENFVGSLEKETILLPEESKKEEEKKGLTIDDLPL